MANLGQTTTSSNRQIVVIDGAWKKDYGRMGMGWALQMVDGSYMQRRGDYGLATSALHA